MPDEVPDNILDLVDEARLLVADVTEGKETFTDEQYEEFLRMESWEPRRAAALAIDAYAVSIAAVVGPVRGLLDLRVGPEQSASVLHAAADRLRLSVPFSV